MGNLRIIYDNAADRAVLTASSQAGALGPTNLQRERKSAVLRSVGTALTIVAIWNELYVVNPKIASFDLAITAGASGSYFTLGRNAVDRFAGAYTATATNGSGSFTYLWRLEGNTFAWVSANNYVNAQVVPGVSGRGVTGEFDLYAICTCTDTNTGQTQTQSFNFIVNFT